MVDGHLASDEFARRPPSLVVLDLNLPGPSGFDLLAAWRERSRVPVVVLTARTELEARIRSFGLGAADYLAKPFWIEELTARIRARLGLDGGPRRVIAWDDVVLDLAARSVHRKGVGPVPLTPHELNVLAYLAERPGRALTRAQIAEYVLPPNQDRADRNVDCHVARIRRKLGPAGQHLRTAWGTGYRFEQGEGEP